MESYNLKSIDTGRADATGSKSDLNLFTFFPSVLQLYIKD